MQWDAVCCSVMLHCVAVCCSIMQHACKRHYITMYHNECKWLYNSRKVSPMPNSSARPNPSCKTRGCATVLEQFDRVIALVRVSSNYFHPTAVVDRKRTMVSNTNSTQPHPQLKFMRICTARRVKIFPHISLPMKGTAIRGIATNSHEEKSKYIYICICICIFFLGQAA